MSILDQADKVIVKSASVPQSNATATQGQSNIFIDMGFDSAEIGVQFLRIFDLNESDLDKATMEKLSDIYSFARESFPDDPYYATKSMVLRLAKDGRQSKLDATWVRVNLKKEERMAANRLKTIRQELDENSSAL